MEAPVTPFSRETEDVLRRARITEAMPVEKRRRLKAAVLARLAAGGVAFVSGEAAASGFWASAFGSATKGFAAVALVASVGVGGYVAVRTSPKVSPAVPARAAIVEPRAAAAPEPAAPATREAPSPSPRVRTPARVQERKPPVELVFVPAPAPPPAVATPAPAPVERSTLAEETRLLREADRALRGGSPEAAITLLDEHASRFPDGVLAPERSAERMVALCQLGKADAAAATRFLANRSSSPLAARIRQACGVGTR
jgi:hypothetical protein